MSKLEGWTKHCDTHWSRSVGGTRLDYWPTKNKWRHWGSVHTGDVDEFITAIEGTQSVAHEVVFDSIPVPAVAITREDVLSWVREVFHDAEAEGWLDQSVAEVMPKDRVSIPQNEEQARAMVLVGMAYLRGRDEAHPFKAS